MVLGALVVNSVEALQTLTRHSQLDSFLISGALLRLQLECLITASWVVSVANQQDVGAPNQQQNRRIAQVIIKTINEQKRIHKDSDSNDKGFLTQAGRYLVETEELRPYQGVKPAPSIKQMADEINQPELYVQYRKWSGEMHAGLGMHIRDIVGHQQLDRIQRVVVGTEYLYKLLVNWDPGIIEEQQPEYASILNTLGLEYVCKLQDAFYSALASDLSSDDELLMTVLADRCGRYRPIFDDAVNSPELIAADAVRGAWQKSGCISVRFKNICKEIVTLRAKLKDDRRRAAVRWWNPWQFSVEEEVRQPPLRLLPHQSGYLTFPAPPPKEKLIRLYTKGRDDLLAICDRPQAALQNTESGQGEIVTLFIDCKIGDTARRRRVLQPIVLH